MVATPEEEIAPVRLGSEAHISRLACRLRELEDCGLFTVAMDHSPSEQLGVGGWHTSVLVSSSRVAHDELAKAVALLLRPTLGTLKKWSTANQTYRRHFLPSVFDAWRKIPDIQMFAQSATENAILAATNHCIQDFRIGHIYKPYTSAAGSSRVQIGPVFRGGDFATPIVFSLAKNRADMCVFIAHFVRMRPAIPS